MGERQHTASFEDQPLTAHSAERLSVEIQAQMRAGDEAGFRARLRLGRLAEACCRAYGWSQRQAGERLTCHRLVLGRCRRLAVALAGEDGELDEAAIDALRGPDGGLPSLRAIEARLGLLAGEGARRGDDGPPAPAGDWPRLAITAGQDVRVPRTGQGGHRRDQILGPDPVQRGVRASGDRVFPDAATAVRSDRIREYPGVADRSVRANEDRTGHTRHAAGERSGEQLTLVAAYEAAWAERDRAIAAIDALAGWAGVDAARLAEARELVREGFELLGSLAPRPWRDATTTAGGAAADRTAATAG